MASAPVVLIEGPRSVGKSSILRDVARARGVPVIDLDDPPTRAAVAADPSVAVSGRDLICIDEYQRVPEVLDAIKAELNKGAVPGRFVLAGSTRHDSLPRQAQALTGRLTRLTVYPFTQGEIGGVEEDFVTTALATPAALVTSRTSSTARSDYVARVCAGGFPLALRAATEPARRTWFDNYVKLSLGRDALELSRLRQGDKLLGLLRRVTGQTGQLLNMEGAGAPIGLTQQTADSYVALLEKLFLVYRLEAWGKTLFARAIRTPKVHVLDSGVGARLLRLTTSKVTPANATALTEYGHLLETFVVTEILKQASFAGDVADYGHFRTKDGEEVDLVIETGEGGIVGFEVKAGAQVSSKDLNGLRRLQRIAGDSFLGGVTLYTGPRAYTVGAALHVVPIDRLWTP